MLYRSELLRKDFKTEEECLIAEEEYNAKLRKREEEKRKLEAEKEVDKTELDEAFKEFNEARRKYNELLSRYCEKYGYAEHKISGVDDFVRTFKDLLF